MSTSNTETSVYSSSLSLENSEPKHCWICFGTEDDDFDDNEEWVSPCRCRGTAQWVHQGCIKRWINVKVIENINSIAHCPQCHTEYIIMYNEVNCFVRILNNIEKISNTVCAYMAVGVFFFTIYYSAATFGAIAVIQVMGEQQGVALMKKIDSYLLLLILPVIPVGLIFSKTINWEDGLLFFIQRITSKLPLLKYIMPSFLIEPIDIETNYFNSSPSFVSAFFLPTAARVTGDILFNNDAYSNFYRTLLGGLVYISIKGALNIYKKQQNIVKIRSRRIVDYQEPNNGENP